MDTTTIPADVLPGLRDLLKAELGADAHDLSNGTTAGLVISAREVDQLMDRMNQATGWLHRIGWNPPAGPERTTTVERRAAGLLDALRPALDRGDIESRVVRDWLSAQGASV